jgi:hypothetical protein
MEYCNWCSRDIVEIRERDDLCSFCNKRYWVKKNFNDPERGYLHDDSPVDEEYRALVLMETDQFAQRTMDQRILRMKSIIQAHWTPEQEQRRAVVKKKVSYSLHNYASYRSRNNIFLKRTP